VKLKLADVGLVATRAVVVSSSSRRSDGFRVDLLLRRLVGICMTADSAQMERQLHGGRAT